MKIQCPHCSQKYEVGEEFIGQAVHCEKCEKDFIVEESGNVPSAGTDSSNSCLFSCPDCGHEVSKRASTCPHCGAPLQAEAAPVVIQTAGFTRDVAEIIYETWPWRLGWFFAVLGTVSVILAIILGNKPIVWPVPAFICFFIMALCFRQRYIKCHRCGYEGDFKTSGGPNGCAFILLLCLGILPGLIYMFAVPTHKTCPRCGQEAK